MLEKRELYIHQIDKRALRFTRVHPEAHIPKLKEKREKKKIQLKFDPFKLK